MCLSVVCLLLILLDGAFGNGFGSCPKYPLMEDFDISKLEGRWFELEKSYKFMEPLNGCVSLDLKAEESKLRINMIILSTTTKKHTYHAGHVVQEITSLLNFLVDNDYDGLYHVLDTDYENFVILWSCYSWGWLAYFDKIWVIGRHPNFSAEVSEQINSILNKFDLDPNRLALSNSLCTI